MSQKSKLHERMCVACGSMREKGTMLRIMKTDEGFAFDISQKSGGRGAYICADPACFSRMCGKRMLNRSFRMSVPETAYSRLQEDYQRIYGQGFIAAGTCKKSR